MESCFAILQLKFDLKLTNRGITLMLKISASTFFQILARIKGTSFSGHFPKRCPMMPSNTTSPS